MDKDDSAIQEEDAEIKEVTAEQNDSLTIEENEYKIERALTPQNLNTQSIISKVFREEEESELIKESFEARDSKLISEKHVQPVNPNLNRESDVSQGELSTPEESKKIKKNWVNVAINTASLGSKKEKEVLETNTNRKSKSKIQVQQNVPVVGAQNNIPVLDYQNNRPEGKKDAAKNAKLQKKNDAITVSVSDPVVENISNLESKKALFEASKETKAELLVYQTLKVIDFLERVSNLLLIRMIK